MAAVHRKLAAGCLLWILIPAWGCRANLDVRPNIPTAERLNLGFDPPSEDRSWRPGDSVIYQITTCDGATEKVSYIRCVVVPQPEADDWPANVPQTCGVRLSFSFQGRVQHTQRRIDLSLLRIERLNDRGVVVAQGYGGLPQDYLSLGFYDSLAALSYPQDRPAGHRLRDAMWHVFSAVAAFQNVFMQKHIFPIVREITLRVIKPDLWQLLHIMDMNLTLEGRSGGALAAPETVAFNGRQEPAMSFDVGYQLGPNLVSVAEITVLPAQPPLHLCGGIVHLRGTAVQDQDRWYDLRLVSARRGSAP